MQQLSGIINIINKPLFLHLVGCL